MLRCVVFDWTHGGLPKHAINHRLLFVNHTIDQGRWSAFCSIPSFMPCANNIHQILNTIPHSTFGKHFYSEWLWPHARVSPRLSHLFHHEDDLFHFEFACFFIFVVLIEKRFLARWCHSHDRFIPWIIESIYRFDFSRRARFLNNKVPDTDLFWSMSFAW